MPRAPSAFKPHDLARALKAVASGGVPVARIEIEPSGKIVIVTGSAETGTSAGAGTDLDVWLRKQ